MVEEQENQSKLTVVGSLNHDIFLTVKRMPQLGETLGSQSVLKAFGGKGANQAIGAARMGASVNMLGQVGDDSEGHAYIKFLGDEAIDASSITVLERQNTGQAYIISQENGENSIILHGGANMAYNLREMPQAWTAAIESSTVLLLQREVPEQVNIMAAQAAKKAACTVVLDMGGMDTPITSELVDLCDIISPNETELERLLPGEAFPGQLLDHRILSFLKRPSHDCATKKLLLKQGSSGSTLVSLCDDKSTLSKLCVPACNFEHFPEMKLVDTTGAGDTYTAAFGVEMAKKLAQNPAVELDQNAYKDCMEVATHAAFLTITRFGAAPALPKFGEVQSLMQRSAHK